MSVIAIFRKLQEHLWLLIVLAKLVVEVLVALHVAMVDKSITKEGKMRAEKEVIDLRKQYQ